MASDYLVKICKEKEHASMIMQLIYHNQGNPKLETYISDTYYQNEIEAITEDIKYFYDDNTLDYLDTLGLLDYLATLITLREIAPDTFAKAKAKKFEELFRAIDNERVDELIVEYGSDCFVRK